MKCPNCKFEMQKTGFACLTTYMNYDRCYYWLPSNDSDAETRETWETSVFKLRGICPWTPALKQKGFL